LTKQPGVGVFPKEQLDSQKKKSLRKNETTGRAVMEFNRSKKKGGPKT